MWRLSFYEDFYELRILLEKIVSALRSRSRYERVFCMWKEARNVDDVRTVRTCKKILRKSAFISDAERSDGSLFYEAMWPPSNYA